MVTSLQTIQDKLFAAFEKEKLEGHPAELYDPIQYIMSLGGKRLRPLLTLLSYSLYRETVEDVLSQAQAVEIFHNFTLMHDDIMDEAPLRRGQDAVHIKWDRNTAILSGDVMLVKAYDYLLPTESELLPEVIRKFNRCAAQVCEGQQLDMLFESRQNVSEEEYLEMIRLKTAVLLGFGLELGAILARADDQDRKALREFGEYMGIGFQLKDDYLDVYGEHEKFGKQVGGDILANKKTFLLINALQEARGEERKELIRWLEAREYDAEQKIIQVTELYNQLEIPAIIRQKMDHYFEKAFRSLVKVKAPMVRKAVLKKFAESLAGREY